MKLSKMPKTFLATNMVHKAEEEPKPVIHAAADSVRDGQIYECQICRTHKIHLKHGRDDVLIPKIFEGEYLLCQGCYWCYRNCNAALVGTGNDIFESHNDFLSRAIQSQNIQGVQPREVHVDMMRFFLLNIRDEYKLQIAVANLGDGYTPLNLFTAFTLAAGK